MKQIISIIKTLSEDDRRGYLAFAKARNQRSDVKNIQLFQLLSTGHTDQLDIKLYGKPNKNALYALSNRLQHGLIDYIASRSLSTEAEEELEILKLLLAARIFLEQQQHHIGIKTLKRAEHKALELELYPILNEIYHTQVQYAHLSQNSLNGIITAYQNNQKKYLAESRLVMAYATVKEKLQNSPADIYMTIEEQFLQFQIEIDSNLTFKSLFQLMQIAVEAATVKSDHYRVAPFMDRIYKIVCDKEQLVNKHLFYYIEILYLMAVTKFRNKNFESSLEFLEKMEQWLSENSVLRNQFSERHLMLKALNLNFTGNAVLGIQMIEKIEKPSFNSQLSHIMMLFQQADFKNAYSLMRDLHHTDMWYEKKAGFNWVVKKNLIEILLFIERHQPDLVESRLSSFYKKYRKSLKNLGEDRVLTYLKLIKQYYNQPDIVSTDAFIDMVERSFDWKDVNQEDLFAMSFYAWLKSKMLSKPLYDVTLDLVN